MFRAPILRLVLLLSALALLSHPAAAQQGGGTKPTAAAAPVTPRRLAALFSDPALWGRDLPAALAQLPAWRAAGETKVALFADRSVGATAFETAVAARPRLERLARQLTAARLSVRPEFASLLSGASAASAPDLSVLPLVPDDERFRVNAAPSSGADAIIAPGLRVATMRRRLGPPEAVEQQLLDTGTERRPVVLTLYSYANGAVVFAESDFAASPGRVDRVYLDVPILAALIFAKKANDASTR